jgi:hypothetical protein
VVKKRLCCLNVPFSTRVLQWVVLIASKKKGLVGETRLVHFQNVSQDGLVTQN